MTALRKPATEAPDALTAAPVYFSQSLDVRRPHTLLTENVKRSGQLTYRYDDDGSTVLVPNAWYNQPYTSRVGYIRWLADKEEDYAKKYDAAPAYGMTPVRAAELAALHRARADRIRAEAARIETAGQATHPVAASILALDFGPNVGG
jgi:hypothetical protein